MSSSTLPPACTAGRICSWAAGAVEPSISPTTWTTVTSFCFVMLMSIYFTAGLPPISPGAAAFSPYYQSEFKAEWVSPTPLGKSFRARANIQEPLDEHLFKNYLTPHPPPLAAGGVGR